MMVSAGPVKFTDTGQLQRPPRFLIAPDSFKGCLAASEVAEAISRGIRAACPEAEVCCVPMADGGEGTLDVFLNSGFELHEVTVADPLGRPTLARYASDGKTAIVELAQAAGLTLLMPDERNPLVTSTYGVGELMLAAAQTLPAGGTMLLCIGGSATNDAGTGLLRALGARFLDAAGEELPVGGAALIRLAAIDLSGIPAEVRQLKIQVACDVDNPLLGKHGASAVFAPQKGASAEMIAQLEQSLTRFAEVVEQEFCVRLHDLAGAGAAGGTAGGLRALLGAALRPGVLLVAQASGLKRRLEEQSWDLVWSGEGRLDSQTSGGKVVAGVSGLAHAAGVPVIALAGQVEAGAVAAVPGLHAAFSLADGPLTYEDSCSRTAELLARQAEQITRLWLTARDLPA